MPALRQILAPHVIRIKKGAVQRLGIYLDRERFERVLLLRSEGFFSDATVFQFTQPLSEQRTREAGPPTVQRKGLPSGLENSNLCLLRTRKNRQSTQLV